MIKFSSYWEQCHFFLGTPNHPSFFFFIAKGGENQNRDSLPPDFKFLTHRTSPTIEGRNTSPYGNDSRNKREGAEEKMAICSDSARSYGLLCPQFQTVFPLPRKSTLFHDSSLVSSVVSSSGGHFCERNACASFVTAAKLIAPHWNSAPCHD